MSVALGIPTARTAAPGGTTGLTPGAEPGAAPGATHAETHVGRHAALPADRPTGPAASALLDRFGRTATDLRISLTDRCNLRCTYCMPAEGLPFLPPPALLTRDEITRLARIAVTEFGVRQIRFTGGEPLLRKDLVDIVRDVAALDPRPEISLTTNAIGLASRAQALADAGLDRINVSLDSVHPETFAAITRRPFLSRVLAGIDAVSAAGLVQTKINTVLMPGVNDDQAVELLEWALAGGHQLRFIEQMALDADRTWERDTMITAAQIRERLSTRYVLTPHDAPRDGAPAELFQVRDRPQSAPASSGPAATADDDPATATTPGPAADPTSAATAIDGPTATTSDGPAAVADPAAIPDPTSATATAGRMLGLVGIIASVSEPFCSDCRRTRLTAEGGVRSCLFSHDETDLLGPMRAGASDQVVADLWRTAMWGKPAGHEMNAVGFAQPERTMSAIGG
ncbi:radical SAM protein [Herbiconiux sp. P15]|uniref:GTP 3',8-cyclase MoaA n=1 Tax=Herbiconiux liukaitaii TaxID=3342799 RepID=UPI0035BAC3A7